MRLLGAGGPLLSTVTGGLWIVVVLPAASVSEQRECLCAVVERCRATLIGSGGEFVGRVGFASSRTLGGRARSVRWARRARPARCRWGPRSERDCRVAPHDAAAPSGPPRSVTAGMPGSESVTLIEYMSAWASCWLPPGGSSCRAHGSARDAEEQRRRAQAAQEMDLVVGARAGLGLCGRRRAPCRRFEQSGDPVAVPPVCRLR